MIGYNTAYFIVVLCLIFSLPKDKKVRQLAFIFMGVVLVCLCGFRHVASEHTLYGNDSYRYYETFLNSARTKVVLWGDDTKDPAFQILTKFIRFFTSNVYVYGFIIAMLTITPVLYLYKKVSSFPVMAVFLYVCMQVGGSTPYFIAFNQMRQALAVGIMCIAVYYYIKANCRFNFNVLLWLIIMTLTHWSSLIFIMPFLLKKIRLNKYIYIALMIVASMTGVFAQRYASQLTELFLLMEQGYYLDDDIQVGLFSNLPLLILSCYTFFISSKEECNSFEHKCLFLQFVVYGLLAPINNSIFRFVIYYGVIGNLAITSSFCKSFKQKNAITIGIVVVEFAWISYVLLASLAGWEKVFPYSIC